MRNCAIQPGRMSAIGPVAAPRRKALWLLSLSAFVALFVAHGKAQPWAADDGIAAPDAAGEVVAEDDSDAGTVADDESAPPATIDTCVSAIKSAERMARDMPEGLLLAIGQTESGRAINGAFGPWPWTLNIAGEGQFFASRAGAVAAAQAALEDGAGNVDLGCMQISEAWHGWAFADLEAMLDPMGNASYAASFLMSLHATHGTWRDAIAHYHSANPARGFAYAARVLQNWQRNPSGARFIAEDESLSDVPRLAETLVDLPQLKEIEAEHFVSVTISHIFEVATAFAVEGAGGRLYISLNDLSEVPFRDRYSLPLVIYDDTVLIDLGDRSRFRARLDEEKFHLDIIASGEVFPEQIMQSGDIVKPEEITPRERGAHLNYSLAGNFDSNNEVGLTASFGAVSYWKNNTLRASFLVDDDLSWKRLSTNLTIDDHEKRRSLILGDTTTPSGSAWGSSRPVFGLRWGTNNRLDPSFSTLADYSIFGVTDIPAVAKFSADGQQVREIELEPGTYRFADLPFPDQYGELTVSVEDVQGQVQYFKVPYIRIPKLFRKGLHTFDYGLGFEQVPSDSPLGEFGGLVGAATHRYGFSDTFTGELHGMVSAGSLAVGATGDLALLKRNALLSSTVAMSMSELGTGFQARLSYSGINRSTPALASGSLQFSSRDFYLGTSAPASGALEDKSRWSLRLSSSLGGMLPFLLNYQFNDTWHGDSSHAISVGRSWSLRDGWSFNFNGSYSSDNDGSSTTVFLGLSKSFGKKRPVHAYVSNSYSDGAGYLETSLQRPKRGGEDWGYYGRFQHSTTGSNLKNASFGVEGETKTFQISANASVNDSNYALNARLSGAVGFLGGAKFFSAALNSPYVLVRSGDAAGLPIQLNYNVLGDTGADGELVGDGLVPFSRNQIAFKPEDLGFDYSISGVDYAQTVVPVSIGGYVVDFPIVEQFPATVLMVDAAGNALPAGTVVFNVDTEEQAGVTMNGMAYFENVQTGHRLEADMGRFGTCAADIQLAPDFEKFDEIGPVICD